MSVASSPSLDAPVGGSSGSLPPAPKFGTGERWPEWKLRFYAYASMRGAECVLSLTPYARRVALPTLSVGGSIKPEDVALVESANAAGERANKKFDVAAAFVYNTLMLCLTGEPFSLLMNVSKADGQGAWCALHACYERRTAAGKAHVMAQLLSVRMKSDESVQSLATRIQGFKLELASMTPPELVPSSLELHALLNALPESFAPLRVALNLIVDLSFSAAVSHLEDEQEKQKLRRPARSSASEEALYSGEATSSAPMPSQSQPRSNWSQQSGQQQPRDQRSMSCFRCNKVGHIAFECPENRNEPHCGQCRRVGHIERDCTARARSSNSWRGGRGGGRGGHPVRGGHSQWQPSGGGYSGAQQHANYAGEERFTPAAQTNQEFAWLTATCLNASGVQLPQGAWVLDSGATKHLCSEIIMMDDVREQHQRLNLRVADGRQLTLTQAGNSTLVAQGDAPALVLTEVWYSPSLAANLLSVSELTKEGCEVVIGEHSAVIRRADDHSLVQTIPKMGNLYVLTQEQASRVSSSRPRPSMGASEWETAFVSTRSAAIAAAAPVPVVRMGVSTSAPPPPHMRAPAVPSEPSALSERELWHFRLGHVSEGALTQLSQSGAVSNLPRLSALPASAAESVCEGCALGKPQRRAFSAAMDPREAAGAVLDRAHADLCGPVTTPTADGVRELVTSLDGGRYLSLIIDEKSRKLFGKMLASKSEAAQHVRDWTNAACARTGRKLKEFHSDNGTEYQSAELQSFFRARGVLHSTTAAYTPQHNGIPERANRTLFEMVRSMLAHALLPLIFWCECMRTAIFLRNRCLTRGAEEWTDGGVEQANERRMTPEEIFSGVRPDVQHLRVVGSDAYMLVQPQQRHGGKAAPRSVRCIFLGYSEHAVRGYRVFNLESGQMCVSRDVRFNENKFSFRGDALRRALGAENSFDGDDDGDVLANMDFEHETRNALWMSEVEHAAEQQRMRAQEQFEAEETERESVPLPTREQARAHRQLQVSMNTHAPHGSASPPLAAASSSRSSVPVSSVSSVSSSVSQRPQRSTAGVLGPRYTPGESITGAQAAAAAAESSAGPASPAVQQPSTGGDGDRAPAQALSAADTHDDTRAGTHDDTRASGGVEAEASSSSSPSALEPASYQAAMQSDARGLWHAAMRAEMSAHELNQTWSLVPLPPGRKAIGNKWVLKVKFRADGGVDKYKARVVAKGFSQREGVDYGETFAPVLKYKTLRVLCALCAALDLELQQMDVTTAFLNADIREEVFMRQPEGFEQPAENGHPQLVCRLNKTLYGTKQASHEWNKEVNSFIVSALGYAACVSDSCLYHRRARSGRVMLLGLFVDDILSAYAREDEAEWLQLKARFMSKYVMKDLGAALLVLGMRVTRQRSTRSLTLDHEVYVEKMLSSFGLDAADPHRAKVPELAGSPLLLSDCPAAGEPMLRAPYSALVGSLQYAAQSLRPDIAHAVNQLSRVLANPGERHWAQAKRVLRYLQHTKSTGLTFRCDAVERHEPEPSTQRAVSASESAAQPSAYAVERALCYDLAEPSADYSAAQPSARELQIARAEFAPVSAWTDADWGGCAEDRKSTTGFVVQVFGCCVSWASKKQPTVALSTAEAEYMAISACLQEVIWVHAL